MAEELGDGNSAALRLAEHASLPLRSSPRLEEDLQKGVAHSGHDPDTAPLEELASRHLLSRAELPRDPVQLFGLHVRTRP